MFVYSNHHNVSIIRHNTFMLISNDVLTDFFFLNKHQVLQYKSGNDTPLINACVSGTSGEGFPEAGVHAGDV